MVLEPINAQKNFTQFPDLENSSISKRNSQVLSTLASKDSSADAPWYQPITDFFYSCWSTLKYYLTCGCTASKEKEKETEKEKPVEEQLKEFFESEEKVKKIFTIDGAEVGIVFNPNGKAITEGFYSGQRSVVIFSKDELSKESLKILKDLIHVSFTVYKVDPEEFGFD